MIFNELSNSPETLGASQSKLKHCVQVNLHRLRYLSLLGSFTSLLLLSSFHAFSHLLALPIWKRLHIVVGFGHKIILAQTSLTLRVTSGHLCVHMMDGHVP